MATDHRKPNTKWQTTWLTLGAIIWASLILIGILGITFGLGFWINQITQ